MGVLSGIGGAVDGRGTIGEWRVNHSSDTQQYVSSNTKQGTGRVIGNKDWSGTYNALGHTPQTMPGDAFTFTGSLDGTNGVTGAAICDQVEITWDIEAGAIISHVVTFSSNGALTEGTAAASDSTVPDPPSSIGTKVEVADVVMPPASPAYVEVPDVRTITLTISRANPSYVSSSTAGETKRVAGPIDVQVRINVYTDDVSGAPIPTVNEVNEVKLYVDATTFWHLKWIMFTEHSDYTCNVETGELVSVTLNGSMDGYTSVAGTPIEGFIKKPDATTWWPAP